MAEKGRIANAFDSFDRLSSREKVMVGGLAVAFLITAVVIIWMVIGNQISDLETRNQTARTALDGAKAQKETYLRNKARMEAYKTRLDTNNVKLVKLLEDQATRLGVTIEEFKENKRYLTENHRRKRPRGEETGPKKKVVDLVEESQTVTIRRVSLERLAKLMAALEGRPEPIKVTRLDVNTLSSDRQVLREVIMTVATYRNEEVEL